MATLAVVAEAATVVVVTEAWSRSVFPVTPRVRVLLGSEPSLVFVGADLTTD